MTKVKLESGIGITIEGEEAIITKDGLKITISMNEFFEMSRLLTALKSRELEDFILNLRQG